MSRLGDVLFWIGFVLLVALAVGDAIFGDWSLLAVLVVQFVGMAILAAVRARYGLGELFLVWSTVGVIVLGLATYIFAEVVQG